MAIESKLIHRQTFTKGMNTVLAPSKMPPDQAVFMLNCRALSTAIGNIGVVTNVKGNVLVETPLPSGENKTIGYAPDEENGRFY